MLRCSALAVALVAVLGVAAPATAAPPSTGPPPPVRYSVPVEGEILRPFDHGAGTYGPGHRGVDFDVAPGTLVRAAAAGRVVHAGPVAGTVWVSIDHRDGVRTSYGPLAEVRPTVGQHLLRGEVLGRLAPGGHGPDGRDRGLHLGARRQGVYLDPLVLLRGRASLRGPVHHAVDTPRRPRPETAPPDAPEVSRLAVPGPARQPAPVDAVAAQPLPSTRGPPSMVGLLHVPTIPHAR